MKKFVKIKCSLQGEHPNWFLEYNNNLSLLDEVKLNDNRITNRIQNRLILTQSEVHGKVEDRSDIGEFLLQTAKTNSYSDLVKRGGTLYIRENGSFMTLSSRETIIDTVYSSYFPVKSSADIVICENDRIPEYKWIKYLQKRFPNKSIKTINFFDTRTDLEVKAHFKGAEFISFSTTFSDMQWFEKAVKNKALGQKMIGYTHCPEKWNEAKNIFSDIEVVESI